MHLKITSILLVDTEIKFSISLANYPVVRYCRVIFYYYDFEALASTLIFSFLTQVSGDLSLNQEWETKRERELGDGRFLQTNL